VTAIVAADVFADLRTVARERAPLFLTSGVIRRAFLLAEERGGFEVDAVSPVRAAARIGVPVLLIHGSADTLTGPEHAKRVYAALAGPKRLILVQGAKHDQSLLRSSVWADIEQWLTRALETSSLPPTE
jgi:alpha-beta hydrolase superfamily lysophospholipase